jgi:cytoplasmic iron level regulating protein YaaA (DUF328/UPF0246 family)
MITLLVSSKTMVPQKLEADFRLNLSVPRFMDEAEFLNSKLNSKTSEELQRLMHVSKKLSLEIQDKIEKWRAKDGTPAWLLFSGDLYKGLEARTLNRQDFEFAQKKFQTLSGLYGILRPLDIIQPYRLELGYKLKVGNKDNLYQYWNNKVAKSLPTDDIILNLSSEEYIKLIRPFVAEGRIITPHFLQTRGDDTKFEAIHAKIARGKMARWIIKNRIDEVGLIKDFKEEGYSFVEEHSTELRPVFVRKIC